MQCSRCKKNFVPADPSAGDFLCPACRADSPALLISGTRLGQYRVIRHLGSGGMGQVYLAHHIILDNYYALKLLKPEAAVASDVTGRLLREARIARKIHHRNLVGIIDAGIYRVWNTPYIVMEYVEGSTLEDLLKSGPLPEPAALYIAECVAQVLVEASRYGIVHRDIKPANILIDCQGEVKLSDLGIAKIDENLVRYDEPETLEETMLGTPDYASPEQLRNSHEVDARADIYSLGATLYHILSGKKPFAGSSIYNVMAKVLEQPPIPLTERCKNISAECSALVAKMMAKDPAERPESAGELLLLLNAMGVSKWRTNPAVRRYLSGYGRPVFWSERSRRFGRFFRNACLITFIAAGAVILGSAWWFDHVLAASIREIPQNTLPEKRGYRWKTLEECAGYLLTDPELAVSPEFLEFPVMGDNKAKLLGVLLDNNFDFKRVFQSENFLNWLCPEIFRDTVTLKRLLDSGLAEAVFDSSGDTLLHKLCASPEGSIPAADLLLSCNIAVNARNKAGETAVLLAFGSGKPELARHLIDKYKAELSLSDIEKISPVYVLRTELLDRKKKEIAGKNPELPEVEGTQTPSAAEKKAIDPVKSGISPEREVWQKEFESRRDRERSVVETAAAARHDRVRNYDPVQTEKLRRQLEAFLVVNGKGGHLSGDDEKFLSALQELLCSGAIDPDLELTLPDGLTAQSLMQLICDGKFFIRDPLLEAALAGGGDPDIPVPDKLPLSSYRLLLEAGRSKFAPFELPYVLSVNAADSSQSRQGIFRVDWETAEKMVLRGADLEIADQDGNTLPHLVSALGNGSFLKLLHLAGCTKMTSLNKSGFTPLETALRLGNLAAAESLSGCGYNADAAPEIRRMGEFCRAVQNGNADQVSYLMGFDVDPAAAWGNQYNALQNACVLGHTGVVKVLLKNGVSPNDYILSSDPRRGSSPLEIALRRDDFELFALLLEYGADPNAPVVNQFGRYSLLFTQIIGRYADRPQLAEQFIVEMLKHDWDINSRDQDNYSAVEWMRAWNVGSLETLRMLKSYGAKDPADTRTLTASPVEFRH